MVAGRLFAVVAAVLLAVVLGGCASKPEDVKELVKKYDDRTWTAERAIPRLVDFLEDPDVEVRVAAANPFWACPASATCCSGCSGRPTGYLFGCGCSLEGGCKLLHCLATADCERGSTTDKCTCTSDKKCGEPANPQGRGKWCALRGEGCDSDGLLQPALVRERIQESEVPESSLELRKCGGTT